MQATTFPSHKNPAEATDTPIYDAILRVKREVSASYGEDFHEFCEHFRKMERESGRTVVTRSKPAASPS